MADKEDRIKARAHQIWEREGHAHGEHERHWDQATREIEEEGEDDEAMDADLSVLGDKDAGIALQSDDAGVEPASGMTDAGSLKKTGRKKKI